MVRAGRSPLKEGEKSSKKLVKIIQFINIKTHLNSKSKH
jgi:hypothetical protein